MREVIGGPFGYDYESTHNSALSQNLKKNLFVSGRSAFLHSVNYMFNKKKINEIEIPCYLCESIINTLKINKIKYSLYKIDKNFNLSPKLKKNTLTLLINYFSLNLGNIEEIKNSYPGHNFLEDATHSILNDNFSFAAKNDCDYFFSLRKVSPVFAGGSSVSNNVKEISQNLKKFLKEDLKTKIIREKYFKSSSKEIDLKYENKLLLDLKNCEKNLTKIYNSATPNFLKEMINRINWREIKKKRKKNFKFLYELLKRKFKIENFNNNQKHITPIFLLLNLGNTRDKVRSFLNKNRIFAPVHWPKIKRTNYKNFIMEKKMSENLLSLPIDQRYNFKDMDYIYSVLMKI